MRSSSAWRPWEVVAVADRLALLEARLERLDARRVKQAPGQGSLDLAPAAGPGTGQPCGESHIAAGLTCHKGAGGAPAVERSNARSPVQKELAHKGVSLDGKLRTADGAQTFLPSFRPADGLLGELQRGASPEVIKAVNSHALKSHIPDMPFWNLYNHERTFRGELPLPEGKVSELKAQLQEQGFRESDPGRFTRRAATTDRPLQGGGGFLGYYKFEYVKKVELDGFEAAHEQVQLPAYGDPAARYTRIEHFSSYERYLPDHYGPSLGTLKYRGERVSFHQFTDGQFGMLNYSPGNGSDWMMVDSLQDMKERYERYQDPGQTEWDPGIGYVAQTGGRIQKIKPAQVLEPWRADGLPPLPGEGPAQVRPEPRVNIHAKAPGGLIGQPCGASWISPDYTCRKAAGGPASVPSAGSSTDRQLSMSEAGRLQGFVNNWRSSPFPAIRREREDRSEYAKHRGLDDMELGALIGYAQLRYQDVNSALRGLPPPEDADLGPDEALGHAQLIGQALEKLPVAAGPAFRGVVMSDAHLAEFRQGAIGRDPAFQSASAVDPFDLSHAGGPVWEFATGGYDLAPEQTNPVIMRFAPGHGGRDISRISGQPGEKEVLIPPGQSFRVSAVRRGSKGREQGLTIIDLEPVQRRDSSTLDSIEARLERLDARRRESPGQIGLNLGGGRSGQPCGESHIAAGYTCHKGSGGAPATAKPQRKAKVELELNTDSKIQLTRKVRIILSGGDRPATEAWAHLYAIPNTIALQDLKHDFVWSTQIHNRAQALGKERGVEPIVKDGPAQKVPAMSAFDLGFEVGATSARQSLDRMEIDPADGALVARTVFRQMGEMLKTLPTGSLLTCSAWSRDGHGLQRRKMYEALGFEFPEGQTHDGLALVKDGKIARRGRADSAADPFEEAFVAAALLLPEFGGAPAEGALDSIEARLARLDARRVKQAPGQGSLDLGGGPGTGQPCGESHIAAGYTCHKGGGPAATGMDRFMALHAATQARKQQQAAAAAEQEARLAAAKPPAGLALGQDKQGRLLVNGEPAKQLSKGNYGDTYKVDTPDGPVLVKVDRLNGGDPMEKDPSVSREQQRLNMATREVENLRKAAALGIGPEPIGDVVKLPENGRLAIAYRMVEGAPLKASYRASEPDTEEAAAILAQPGARERLDAGVVRIARAMADAGLEHGDMHGANIVVKPDGSPVLIDWAITSEDPPGAAANRGHLEARMLLQMNYYTQTLNRHSPDGEAVANGLARRLDNASQGLRAASELQGTIDMEWEERNLTGEGFGEALTKANSLVKQGLSYDAAQRQAGMLPMLTPEMKRATAAARDAIFGDADLAEMRRWIDSQVLGGGA
jgi:hypothetical protein